MSDASDAFTVGEGEGFASSLETGFRPSEGRSSSDGTAPVEAAGEGWWAVVRDGAVAELHGFDPRGLLAGEIVPAPAGTRLLDTWDGERFSRPAPLVPPPPAPREVRKLLIVDRLDAGGLLDAAMQALASDARAKFRWDAATGVRADDAQVRALLAAIGADPDAYLAPEGEASGETLVSPYVSPV